MKKSMRKNTDAVSPVVGVMLMLSVTVILAAVVSAYAGGTVMPAQKAPSGTFECKIVNGGTWDNSGFTINVLSVSEPIPTKDVKLITSWRASDGTADTVVTTGPPGKTTNCYYSGFMPGEQSMPDVLKNAGWEDVFRGVYYLYNHNEYL